ncbi:MAG TPA: choice-of-anchor V domain-containing protein [Candidatus Thermoplasmatota archaeon]|nr:choice-of-anchor V domain-containing protein [Candidatus Thermoplasmatota archaeon]
MPPFSWSKPAAAAAIAAVAALVAAPTGWSLSGGAMKDTIQDPNFATKGCVACHGSAFAPGGSDVVHWTITGPAGAVAGNTYEKGVAYTINITLDEAVAVDGGAAGNHAGFNLRASAGKLGATNDQVQVSGDQTQATHTNAANTHWSVQWTAPDSGPVVFDLLVNDVDGSGSNNAGDRVHRVGFYLTDATFAQPGAIEGEVHYGISLQQYWIGLIGLAGMLFIMGAGYFYLKYGSRHNTDAKDR